MADVCSMVHFVCLFMKTHLVALLQGNCLDLVNCAFLRKLSACVRNITAFCQHLLRPIKSSVLADIDISVKPKYRPGQYIGLSLHITTIPCWKAIHKQYMFYKCHTIEMCTYGKS